MSTPPRCDIAVYEEWCAQWCAAPPTHRYRGPWMVEGHWSHRCAQHVRLLSAPDLVVEPLAGEPL